MCWVWEGSIQVGRSARTPPKSRQETMELGKSRDHGDCEAEVHSGYFGAGQVCFWIVLGVRGQRRFVVEGKRWIENDLYNLVKANEWVWWCIYSWESWETLVNKCCNLYEGTERYVNNKYMLYEEVNSVNYSNFFHLLYLDLIISLTWHKYDCVLVRCCTILAMYRLFLEIGHFFI